MLPTLIILVLLAAIVIALGAGAYFLLKDRASNDHRRTMTALTWRVSLQAALIVFLIVAYFMGWIQPHNLQGR